MTTITPLSILVPIYNVEQYLPTCLDSLVQQTLKDLEIICINDGSTDSSLDIIKSYQAKYPELIKLIDKPNTGYGDSMNQGLKEAKGLYIGIVEPDDYIDTDAFQKLWHLAENNNLPDLIKTNYYTHTDGQPDQKTHYLIPQITHSELPLNQVICPRDYPSTFYQPPAIWAAIYRREFLEQNQIEFLPTPGASYQDTGFNFKVLAAAKKAYFSPEAFLHYRTDNASSSVKDAKKAHFVSREYAAIEEYLREHQLFDQLAPVVEAAKFDAYAWNLLRLKRQALSDFLMTMKTEFLAAKKSNLLDSTYFEPAKWQLLNYIIDHQVSASVRKVQRLKLKRNLRAKFKSLWLKTHPTYRRQQQIAETIAAITTEQEALRTELEKLKSQKTEPTHV